MKKTLSALSYLLLWIVLVVAQTLLISTGDSVPSVWMQPDLYYSMWTVDVYLILIFYLNYYALAPQMVRRRLFAPYAVVVGVSALIGFLIPIFLKMSLGWSMPGFAPGEVPLSSLGVLGAICVMSLGLAARSLVEWMRLSAKSRDQDKELEELRPLKEQISSLRTELEGLRSKLQEAEQGIIPPASVDDAPESLQTNEYLHSMQLDK